MPRSHRASFVLPLRVYYEDTDAAGIVYYANYLRFLERGRTEWLRALGYGQQQLAQTQNLAFAVRSLACEYLKPARLDQQLNVISEIESMGRAQIVFAQRIERPGQMAPEILLTATVRVACIEVARLKPRALPKEMRDTFATLTDHGVSQRE